MQRNLYKTYGDYFGKKTAISFKTLEYYDMITYTVLQDDDVNVDVKIHVDDVIDIEDDNGIEIREYALIRGIFTHIANDKKRYAFFILDWYYNTNRMDNFTGSKIYGLQESNNISWPHIHSFHIVDRVPHIHFVRNGNSEYLLNEFFYITVSNIYSSIIKSF